MGLAYKIASHLWESCIVWFNGLFPAATGDQVIHKIKGLMQKIPDGRKCVADKIHTGCDKVALHNSLDSPKVHKFKARARAHQESVNA